MGNFCCTVDERRKTSVWRTREAILRLFVTGEFAACAQDLLTVGAPGDATIEVLLCVEYFTKSLNLNTL